MAVIDNIPLPRLLASNEWDERRIDPIKVSIDLNITPLSTATIQLPEKGVLPNRGYIELYTCMGSAGIFRICSPQETYGAASSTAELEHAIVEVGDYLVLHEYKEMMAASTAMTTVFSHYRGSRWQLGSVSALGNDQIALEANYDRVLEVMLSILEQKTDCMMSFDFTTTPWTVNIVKKGTTVAAEGRFSRNISNARITFDDTELCTRVYYEKLKANPDTTRVQETEWAHVDADTMAAYGVIEHEVETSSDYTADEALKVANTYLKEHKYPRISVEVSAEELSSITGEDFDTFTIGKLMRLVLDESNSIPVEKNITGLSFPDVYGRPHDIEVSFDQDPNTLINIIHDVDQKKGGGGSGGGGGKKKQDDFDKEFYADFINTKNMVGMVVGTTDGQHSIRGGQIVLSINADGGTTAVIQADCIDIQGIVEALVAYDVTTESFHSLGTITADGEAIFNEGLWAVSADIETTLTADDATFDTLTVNGHGASWQNTEVVTDISSQYYTGQYFAIADANLNITGRQYVAATSLVTPTKATIHYLGY